MIPGVKIINGIASEVSNMRAYRAPTELRDLGDPLSSSTGVLEEKAP